jgi:hypothetical protein
MNAESMSCQRLISVVMYPPVAMQPVDVTQLYAELAPHYPYQSFQHLPDGARLANPDGDVFIQVNRVQVNENVNYFPAAKEKVRGYLRDGAATFQHPAVLESGS